MRFQGYNTAIFIKQIFQGQFHIVQADRTNFTLRLGNDHIRSQFFNHLLIYLINRE